MPLVRVDGNACEARDGSSILDAVRALGIHLPALCHDDRLEPSGTCRACLVEVSGLTKPVPACITQIADGMDIVTATPELRGARGAVLEMLSNQNPARAVTAFPHEPFQRD